MGPRKLKLLLFATINSAIELSILRNGNFKYKWILSIKVFSDCNKTGCCIFHQSQFLDKNNCNIRNVEISDIFIWKHQKLWNSKIHVCPKIQVLFRGISKFKNILFFVLVQSLRFIAENTNSDTFGEKVKKHLNEQKYANINKAFFSRLLIFACQLLFCFCCRIFVLFTWKKKVYCFFTCSFR